jgi:hypothetical protein
MANYSDNAELGGSADGLQLNALVEVNLDSLKEVQGALAETRKLAKQVKLQNSDIQKQNEVIKVQNDEFAKQKRDIKTVQAIVAFGFIIALFALFTVILSSLVYWQDSMRQITQQTQLLQQLNDKIKQ